MKFASPPVEPPAEPDMVVTSVPPFPSVVTRAYDADLKPRAGQVRTTSSTGGTAEPNDKPYGDVFFEHSGVNPFVDSEDDALSTFGLEVDTGSFTVARRSCTTATYRRARRSGSRSS